MRFDEHKHDGVILIGANRSRGIWANQVQSLGARVTRNGGRMNGSASNHTLLSVALLSALRGITSATVTKLLAKRYDARTKSAFEVRTIDPTFFAALTAVDAMPTLRAIKSLRVPLARQMSRFDLTLNTEPVNNAILAVVDWAGKNVLDPIEVDHESPVLIASIVNGLGTEFQITGAHVRF